MRAWRGQLHPWRVEEAELPQSQPREDLFISICFADPEADAGRCASELSQLASRLAERFRYWEILLGVPAEAGQDYADLARSVPNLRLLNLRAGTPHYRRRVAVASEAIGDMVVVTALSDLGMIDPLAVLDLSIETGAIVIGRLTGGHALSHVLRALGRGAGYRVDPRDMQTAAYPRTLLNLLLSHPDRTLAMRFPPEDGAIPVRWVNVSAREGRRGNRANGLARRLGLIYKLLIASAPRVLSGLSILSLLVMAVSAAYCIYAVVVWISFSQVQPGWFTTSIISGMTTGFLGTATFALAIGVQRLLDLVAADVSDDVVGEVAAVDLYFKAMQELNIEYSGVRPDAAGSDRAPSE